MLVSHRLYVGTIGEGLFRSLDGGETFIRACDGMFVECHVRSIAPDSGNPAVLWLGSEQGLFHSADGADHWSRVESPLNGRQIWSILLVPNNPDVIVVGACPARLFRSGDGGATWTEADVPIRQECPRIMQTRVTTIIADPTQCATLWAGVEIDGIYRSDDEGKTWRKWGEGLSSQDIHGLVIVPGPPRRMLASTNNDMNLSVDGGSTWQPQKIGRSLPWSYCRTLAQIPGRPEIVLLGNGDAPPGSVGVVARSTNGGQSWEVAKMPGRANSTLWNFAVHPANPDLIYAASVSGQLYRSTDRGATWVRLAREFGEIRALAWTP